VPIIGRGIPLLDIFGRGVGTPSLGNRNDNYASALDAEIVPFWRDAGARLDKVELEPTSPSYGNFQFIRNVANGRLHAFETALKGLRHHDTTMVPRAMRDMRSVDELITDKLASDKQQP
jgi:hypothetical protein